MSQEQSTSSSVSVRNLPAGKLQNLKKLFEEKDAQASGATVFGASPPKAAGARGRPTSAAAQPGRPASTATQPGRPASAATQPKSIPTSSTGQPKPAPRHGSPARNKLLWPDLVVVPSAANLPQRPESSPNGGTLPRQRQHHMSEKQEWETSTLERKAIAQKRMSPTVSQRVAQFSGDNANGEKNGSGMVKQGVDHRFGSPAARSGSPKRLSDPCTDTLDAASKRNSSERRRTVDNVSFGPSTESKSSEVKVAGQMKRFEGKPSIPRRPVGTVAAQNAPGSAKKTLDKSGECSDNTDYDIAWDVQQGKNIERLKAIGGDRSSALAIKPSDQGAGKQSAGSKASTSVAVSPPKGQASRPSEQPPPPPSKPLRTFAHDDYLQTKCQGLSTNTQNTPTTGKGRQTEGERHSNIKERVTLLTDGSGDKEKVTLQSGDDKDGDSYSHLGRRQNKVKGIRETPPARPPPPRPRPISEGSALRNRHDVSPGRGRDGSDSENEGPVVVSLKHGRIIGRQVSMSGPHRNPGDQLPDTPEKTGLLQRFPLRKSFSSECLYKGSMSSLSGLSVEEDPVTGSMMRSYHAKNSGEPLYEALIDSDGYAVPHKFLRIQVAQETEGSKGSQPSRPGFLKRVLGPSSSAAAAALAVPTTTPIKEQDVEKVPRKKMNLVKQKINQAYESLHVMFRRSSTSEEAEQDGVDAPTLSNDRDSNFTCYILRSSEFDSETDSIVDVKEIKQRVSYCSTVRMKTVQNVKKAREFMDTTYPQLFEYAIIVGLCAKTDDPGYEPYIIHKFPQTVDSNVSVPKFCFPDADEFRPGSMTTTSESYSFVLTNIDGGRMFGYCRRIQPRDASLPEVICIISPVDAFNMYNKLLSELEARRSKSLDHAQEMIASSFGRPLPKPGKICHIRSLNQDGEMETMFLERPSDNHMADVNYESLLLFLGTDKLIKVFASMLMERRLILCSKSLSVLTQTIHALVALLYPFRWQHVYIPLLPPDMLEVCAAPMPFLVGILQSHLPRVLSLELEDMIIVDLDQKEVVRSMGDELTLIPRKVQKALKSAINMCKIDSDARNSQWLMVSEAFLRMFLETLGHFSQHISTQQDGTRRLLRDQFIAGTSSKGIRQFLEWFTETQMFEVFINMHLERQEHWGSMDLFMARLGELHSKKQTEGSHSRGLGQKVKNLGKVIKTKLKEAT